MKMSQKKCLNNFSLFICLLSCFISFPHFVKAQNVGIGTITPTFPLTFAPVVGDKISLWNGASMNSYGLGIQSYLLQIHTDIPEADIAFGSGRSAAFAETMRIKGNGKVGIGITNPLFQLDVRSGSINTDSVYRIGTLPVLAAPGTNIFVGQYAGYGNTSGSYNSIVGYRAGFSNSTGNHNSFFGNDVAYFNTTGSSNSFFGNSAGKLNTIGMGNCFFGQTAGYSNSSGDDNCFFGLGSGQSNTTGSANCFYGAYSGLNNTTGSSNCYYGIAAGYANTSGINNSFFGDWAGKSNTTGFNNSFFGRLAGQANGSGANNSFFGTNAGIFNSSGSENSFFGLQSGANNTTGNYNSFYGSEAGNTNTTARYNSFFGRAAGYSNSVGEHNSFFGQGAGNGNDSGFQNTAVGAASFQGNSTGSYHTALGYNTGPNGTNYVNTTCLGIDATATGSDMVRIGNVYVGSIGGFQAWTSYSDERFKQNIKEDVPGLNFIIDLRPVTYTLDVAGINHLLGLDESEIHSSAERSKAASDMVHTGFIAQEVEQAAQKSGYIFSGVDAPKNNNDFYGLRYAEFVVPLVKAVQELQAINEEQNKKIELLLHEIELLKEKG